MWPIIIVVAIVVAVFASLFGMLTLLDRIAYARGLPGAHPLSPAVALSLLVWAIFWCITLAVVLAAIRSGAQP